MTTDDNVTEIVDALARVSRAAKRAVLEELRVMAINCAQSAAVDIEYVAPAIEREYHVGRRDAWDAMVAILTERIDAQSVKSLDTKAAVDA